MLFKISNKKLIKNIDIPIKKNNQNYYCLDGGTIFIYKVQRKNYALKGKGGFIKVKFPENIDIDTKEDLLLAKKFIK